MTRLELTQSEPETGHASIFRAAGIKYDISKIIQVVADSSQATDEVLSRQLARIRADDVLILDVRPADEYAKGHIPTAINIPLSELEARMAGLPRDRLIVAYCRGPYCVFSVEAVALLRAQGFEVRRLEDGLPEWRTAGLSVEP